MKWIKRAKKGEPSVTYDQNARVEIWVEWDDVEIAVEKIVKSEKDPQKRLERVRDLLRDTAYDKVSDSQKGIDITVELGNPERGSAEEFIQYAEDQIAEEEEPQDILDVVNKMEREKPAKGE